MSMSRKENDISIDKEILSLSQHVQDDDIITNDAIEQGIAIEVRRTLPFWRCYEELKYKYKHTPVLLNICTVIVSRLPCYCFTNVYVIWAETTFTLRVQTRKTKRSRTWRNTINCQAIPNDICISSLEQRYDKVASPSWQDETSIMTQNLNCDNASKNVKEEYRKHEYELNSKDTDMATLIRNNNNNLHIVGNNNVRNDADDENIWKCIPYIDQVCKIGTMHFVHYDAHHVNSHGWNCSFHIQSVIWVDRPCVLQCVAGQMTHVGLLLHMAWRSTLTNCSEQEQHITDRNNNNNNDSISNEQEINVSDIYETSNINSKHWLQTLPEANTTNLSILILGMGGNSMALSLNYALGKGATITIVEKELAVLQTCQGAKTFVTDIDLCSKEVEQQVIKQTNHEELSSLTTTTVNTKTTATLLSSSVEHSQKHIIDSSKKENTNEWEHTTFVDTTNNVTVIIADAEQWLISLNSCDDRKFDLIFTDLFTPEYGTMNTNTHLLQIALKHLRNRASLLIVNTHELPNAHTLQPFATLVGSNNIHAINVGGWKESIIVMCCPNNSKENIDENSDHNKNSNDEESDKGVILSRDERMTNKLASQKLLLLLFTDISITEIRKAEQFYLNTLHDWLPQTSWFRSSKRVKTRDGHCCRV